MIKVHTPVTDSVRFFGSATPVLLVEKYGSPLFVYNESILRERCRELKNLIDYENFSVNYSAKANSNLELLKIVNEEGLSVDAMSPGEIHVELAAGFTPDRILYISNNVSAEEMRFAVEQGIMVSLDSLSQLKLYGVNFPGTKVALRFNPGVGAGHHEKVVTAGKKTKFGIAPESMDQVKAIVEEHSLTVAGINQHIGSLFMDPDAYVKSTCSILSIAKNFDSLEFVDFGGGFGIPYRKSEGEKRLDLDAMRLSLSKNVDDFIKDYGRKITIKIEPGRYIAAECGVILGTVHSVKENYGSRYVGTDVGFNVLSRPVMYDSHHEIEIFRPDGEHNKKTESVKIVGNICETGDILADDRDLPVMVEKDIIAVLDAGAYGFCMSSNYNNRLKPAEVLIAADGSDRLIRRRDTLEDLMRNF
ncbi:MAG: diaminopimelate decarboxylase [Spirochaetes bacterium]|jgi:diaminopimelate decarboxylase|nr:diaminopimelate decarboxylase [Spirochaetota bacterium]